MEAGAISAQYIVESAVKNGHRNYTETDVASDEIALESVEYGEGEYM